MIKDRKELELSLIQPTLTIKKKRKIVSEIKDKLLNNNNILVGNVQSWINDPKEELPNLDPRLLCLFAEEIYEHTKTEEINPKNYFTEHEIKKARQFNGKLGIEDDLEFPISFSPVIALGKDMDKFSFAIDLQTLAKLSASQKLNYNFDIQREAKIVKKGNEVFKEATLHMSNVNDIKKNLLSGEQEVTSIVLNAAIRTADDNKNELDYDPKTLTLTVNSGTRLDIADGFHRIRATELAVNESPNIEGEFNIIILNYSDDRAAKWQGQFARQTPVSRHRAKYLEASSNADLVVKELMKNSDLKGRVSDINQIHKINNELVSYILLRDSVDKYFKLDKMVDVYDVQDYLKKFFNVLLGSFPEEFMDNVNETRKVSLINANNMFLGYILLSSRMFYKGIDAGEVHNYIRKIDFKNKNLWIKNGVLNEKGNMDTDNSRKAIEEYFNRMEL